MLSRARKAIAPVKVQSKDTDPTYQFNEGVHTLVQMLSIKTNCGKHARFVQVDPEKSGEEGVLADLYNPMQRLRSIEAMQAAFEKRRSEEGHKYGPVTAHIVHSAAPTPLVGS